MSELLIERFRAYIEVFNSRDCEALVAFYAPEIHLVIGNGTELHGRRAIADFYRRVNDATTREVEIIDVFCDGARLAAELRSEFLALRDAPDFTSGPMAKGDRMRINSFAIYDLRGELFARIRAAVFHRQWLRANAAQTDH